MNSSKKQKNLTFILSIKKYYDESKCHTILLFIKDIIKKGLAAGVSHFKVYLLPDVLIPINDPSKFIKNSDNKSLIFDKLNDVKHGTGYRDLSGAQKLVEYDTNSENFFVLFADERVIIPYGQTLPTPDKGLISSVFTVKVKNQENHYYHKLSEYGFNNIFLINEFKDLDQGFEPLKKGSFLSNLFSSEKKIDISMAELITEEIEDANLRDIARMNEQTIEYSGFTNKIFNFDPKIIETFLRKSTSSNSVKSENSDKKTSSAQDLDNVISPTKSEEITTRDFNSESPLIIPSKINSEPVTPFSEEYKKDDPNFNDMKKSNESDTNIVKKASSPNNSVIVSENQSVSPPSTSHSQNNIQTNSSQQDMKKSDTPSANEGLSSGNDILMIWDNKLDFVKSNLKGLPSNSEQILMSEFSNDAEYSHSVIIILLNQFGALGREKEEFCNNLLKKFDKKLKLAYISLDSKNPSLDLVYSDKKKVESVRALYSKIKDKFAMEAKEATKLNSFLVNMISNKK